MGYAWRVTERGVRGVDLTESVPRRRHGGLLALSVVLVAINLRPAVAGVGPVLPELRAGLPLSGAGAAVLTTLPVLCFGLLATVAPRLARRYGIEPVLVGVMAALAVGALARVLDGPPLLFAGTVVAGGAIAIGNVLIPPLVKRDFPDRSGLMMGVYTMSVSGAAAVAAGIAVPLADASDLGWRASLGFWAIPAAVAALGWLPRMRGHTRPPGAPPAGRSLLRDPLAWQLTVFFGLQSLSFYAILAWLPSMYRDFGTTPAVAGFLLSFSGLVQIPVSLVVPSLANRATHQIWYAVVGTVLIAAGLVGVLLAPMAAMYLWVALIGFGQGACFALGLNLFVLRTQRVVDTARVSAMAQSIGYTLCAFGPLLVGLLHDATGSWTVPLVLLLALLVPQLVCGALAGRARTLRT
jgi:CP family cyanate transporter-like MFS transporter